MSDSHSVAAARYASLVLAKSPANCDAQPAESNLQTHSNLFYNKKHPVPSGSL
ncbi:DUF6783 domain-containing protein [Lachnospiraceae bacterium 45-P1]